MDTVAGNLKPIRSRVVIPTSVPGLVTDRMLVMSYLDGLPLTQLGTRANLSEEQKRMALRRVRPSHCMARCCLLLRSGDVLRCLSWFLRSSRNKPTSCVDTAIIC
jgi:hypothetical protein